MPELAGPPFRPFSFSSMCSSIFLLLDHLLFRLDSPPDNLLWPNRTAKTPRLARCSLADEVPPLLHKHGKCRATRIPFFVKSPVVKRQQRGHRNPKTHPGTSPGIFCRRRRDFLYPTRLSCPSCDWLLCALPQLFPCASIRLVRRLDQGRLFRPSPSPPPHGDPGAKATFSSLSSNLPGAGPRPNCLVRTSLVGGFYEELSHQGHPQRWHCRPRRHRENATGVVVALHRGHDSALGKSCGRQHNHRLGRRRDRQKNLHPNRSRPRRMARHPDWTLRFFRESQN